MFSFRGDINLRWNNSKPIIVQVIDIINSNTIIKDDQDDLKSNKVEKKYLIQAFGVTSEGYSISMNITDFTPHFYIKIDFNFSNFQVKGIISFIKDKLNYYNKECIIDYDVVMRKDVWGFTNNKKFKFLRILFKNTSGMNDAVKIFKKHKINGNMYKDSIYESNISPLLRFIHINKIEPSNWIKIEPNQYTLNLVKKTRCQIDIDVNWKKVKPLLSQNMAPFIKLSFDIECDSSHGDFPLANKNYKKLATELYDCLKKLDKNINKKMFIKSAINSAISQKHLTYKNISKVYIKDNASISEMMLDRLAQQLEYVFNDPLSYKLLATSIICQNEIESLDEMKTLICDCFSDDYSEKITDIEMIYTKVNRKPTEKCIHTISDIIFKLCEKLYTSIELFTHMSFNRFISVYKKTVKIKTLDDKIQYILKHVDISLDSINKTIHYIEFLQNQMISVFKKYFPIIDDSRDIYIKRLCNKIDALMPPLEGDKVIQIGSCVQINGSKKIDLKHIITLDTCDKIDGAIVESYQTEEEVLLAWSRFIQRLDPDIITGYNIFGFDFKFINERVEVLGIAEEFHKLGRIKDIKSKLEYKKLASSALGDNNLSYITMEGRVQMDLLKVIQRDHNLVSYKLDYVAENFMNDAIKSLENTDSGTTILKIKGENNLLVGNFITIFLKNDNKYQNGRKFKIIRKEGANIEINYHIKEDIFEDKATPRWQLAKDDVSPKEIFEFQKLGPDKRCIVAEYCIQDCALCLNIINKLNIVTNNMGMSNVCSVPLSFIFLRGQGIKIFSLISRECRKGGFLIPVKKHIKDESRFKPKKYLQQQEESLNFTPEEADDIVMDNDGGYEGAIVLKPKPGIYLDTPVTVLDYSSLYPSSMISENISLDSIILDENSKYLGEEGGKLLEKIGYDYNDITHDVYKWVDPKIKSKGKIKVGIKTVRFVQPKDGDKGIIPTTLRFLLKARKETRKKAKYSLVKTKDRNYEGIIEKTENKYILKRVDGSQDIIDIKDIVEVGDRYNEDEQAVLDGYQLAFKMTANSTYGQVGAPTSAIYLKDMAASTTAVGRGLLDLAQKKVEEKFEGAEIVYGDTDSIFINFNPRDDTGVPLKGKAALQKSIDLGVQAEGYIQQFLKAPHKLEYEKTFIPFILFSKKRYIGNKYEFNVDKYKQTSMGIVLKRRDNADIVKHIYGGILEIIMNEKNIEKSIVFCKRELEKLLNGDFSLDMLVITKSLRGYYKNPDQIAHKVLADRIGVREPGNKPQSTDRIPYVFIENKKAILQGEKIETPSYIIENKIKPDYLYYITNQIMNPVCQIYALILETLSGYNLDKDYYKEKYIRLIEKNNGNIEKSQRKIDELRTTQTSKIIFGETLRKAENKKNKVKEISSYFKVIK